jgi:hypothetical protein
MENLTSLNDEWEYLEELCKRLIEYDRKKADLEM